MFHLDGEKALKFVKLDVYFVFVKTIHKEFSVQFESLLQVKVQFQGI